MRRIALMSKKFSRLTALLATATALGLVLTACGNNRYFQTSIPTITITLDDNGDAPSPPSVDTSGASDMSLYLVVNAPTKFEGTTVSIRPTGAANGVRTSDTRTLGPVKGGDHVSVKTYYGHLHTGTYIIFLKPQNGEDKATNIKLLVGS
jgi:hypothetical protein